MREKKFPPLPEVLVLENDKHMKSIAYACRTAAIAQSVVVLAAAFGLWKVYAWKDLDHALHIVFLSLGLVLIGWLSYLFLLLALTVYGFFCFVFLLRAAFVYSSPDKRMIRAWWSEALYGIVPFGTLVGIYISCKRKKWLHKSS